MSVLFIVASHTDSINGRDMHLVEIVLDDAVFSLILSIDEELVVNGFHVVRQVSALLRQKENFDDLAIC